MADDIAIARFVPPALQQQGTGRDAHYDVTVASPELPCGAAWLASALLELGVPLWRPWGIDDTDAWIPLAGNHWRYAFPGSGWSRLVPALVDGRCFRLRTRPVPRFTHAWPGQLPVTPRVVVVVRDPRDALYSAWRRARRGGQPVPASFAGWAADEHRELPMSRAQHTRIWWQAWLTHLAGTPHRVLRFEDFKRAPRAALRAMLAFLGVRTPGRAAARARRAAQHEHFAAAERTLLDRGVIATPTLAGGVPYEWRGHFTEADHASLGPGWDGLLAALGYEAMPPALRGREAARIDADATVAALLRGSGAGPAQANALRRALGEL